MNFSYANALIVSSLVSVTLAIIALQRRKVSGAIELCAILIGLAIWSFMYAMRWTTDNPAAMTIWLNLSFTGMLLAPPAMVLFAHKFARRTPFTRGQISLFIIEPVITLLLIWTDPFHGLFFGGMRNLNSVFSGGIWFWFNTLYTFALMFYAIIILFKYSQTSPAIGRYQSRIILLGFLLPIVICISEVAGLIPFRQVDFTPLSFIISGILVVYGFLYYNLLDVAPIAYSKLIHTSTDGLIVIDENFRLVDVNPAGKEIFRIEEDYVGKNVEDVLAAWPEILSALDDTIESSSLVHIENHENNSYEVSIIHIGDTTKHSEGWFLLCHDVTTFKNTEKALIASENKIRSLFQSLTDIVLVIDKDGKYLEIAPTHPQVSELDPLQVKGKTIFDVFPEKLAQQILESIRRALDTKTMVQIDYPVVVEDKEVWFSGNVSPLTSETVIWVARDITERRQMEQSIRENETRLEMAQSIAHVGSWELNLITNDFWVSDEYYRVMNIDKEIPIRKSEDVFNLITLIKGSSLDEIINSVITNQSPLDEDVEIIRPGEKEPRIFHSVINVIFDRDGKPYKLCGAIQDITIQKQVERSLEKRMAALTRPLDSPGDISLDVLFNIDELQKLQDDFAEATGVASLITYIDGKPVTRASNFCRLCEKIIRQDPVGELECEENDSEICRMLMDGTAMVPCRSIGLMHAGAPIVVEGKLLATWLIGQVRSETSDDTALRNYISRLNLNEEEALAAYREIPFLPSEKFSAIVQLLLTISTQLSHAAFQNIQQARFISERKQAEEALRVSENKLRSLFKAMTDVIIIYDSSGKYREIAPTGSQRYYKPPTETLNHSITEVFPPEIASLFMRTIHQTLATNEMTSIDYSLTIEGHEYWFSANVSPLTEDTVIWVAHDISDRKKIEDSLHYQSNHDILTGLYNRQYYETEIERLQRSRLFPISILVMDVDGLKWVNDHRGHNAGDELLKRVSSILKSSFRPEDMVARMGGDEFVVIIPETDEPAARQAMTRLETILEKHNQMYPKDQTISLSIGMATGGQGILLSEVFKVADQDMYIKKNKKKELAARLGNI